MPLCLFPVTGSRLNLSLDTVEIFGSSAGVVHGERSWSVLDKVREPRPAPWPKSNRTEGKNNLDSVIKLSPGLQLENVVVE